ncbi:uncharacterized protein LOC132197479 isoform X2 [Neocloeon triangulifer]|uniref:uncharacterized protein LOC132197479 isoform X2 n=1 Tax=Neocloeon triangulifer TaxID=2078957 RepID=UPI00286EFA75|nr:uncharacterized protein LOC132197479 isoform X2 [Neocloeon triangulifer]
MQGRGHENVDVLIGPAGAHANLGYFLNKCGKEQAPNVFVLVAHYDFEGSAKPWLREGNDKDVKNLQQTFEARNCKFHDLSPRKDELLALLANKNELKKTFGASDSDPSVFVFIILSHGGQGGKIYTDKKKIDPKPGDCEYETFSTKDLFGALENTFPKCLNLLFLGPCRGELLTYHVDAKPSHTNETELIKYSSKVTVEPNLHNWIIFYSTVDGMQNRIHEWVIKNPNFVTGRIDEQTMESKFYPQDRFFNFSALQKRDLASSANGGAGDQQAIDFDWMNPQLKSVFRGRLAAIFHYESKKNKKIEGLQSTLVENLGFETKYVPLVEQNVDEYFNELKGKSWSDYGCFAAFFFAKITEQNNEIYIKLNGNKTKPIGKLIHSLLGPHESNDWKGKPKLFILVDVEQPIQLVQDGKPKMPDIEAIVKFRDATPHSGWMVFILRNEGLLDSLFEIFEREEIKGERSLQECLSDLFVCQERKAQPETMFVTTLPHLLHFRRTFVKPRLKITLDKMIIQNAEYEKLIENAKNLEDNRIWILSGLPGSGKTTVLSEVRLELCRSKSDVRVFKVHLVQDVLNHLSTKIDASSTTAVISLATGVRKEEIDNLVKIKKDRIILMFDGFDEIADADSRDVVLNFLLQVIELEVPIWISTRSQEKEAIIEKIGASKKVCRATIRSLKKDQQIELMRLKSKIHDDTELKRLLDLFEYHQTSDILSNPLHLTMILELGDSILKNDSLFTIYDKIFNKKIHGALELEYTKTGQIYKNQYNKCIEEMQDIALKFLIKTKPNARGNNRKWLKGLRNFFWISMMTFMARMSFIINIILRPFNLPQDIRWRTIGDPGEQSRAQAIKRIQALPRTGILTHHNGLIVFGHRTFAEFLCAQHYVTVLGENNLHTMPFDLFQDGFRQVRSFVEIKISDEKKYSIYSKNLTTILSESFTKKNVSIIIDENLATMLSIVNDHIIGSKKYQLRSADCVEILKKSCAVNQDFASEVLSVVSVEDVGLDDVRNMLNSAIKKNFMVLFSNLVDKFTALNSFSGEYCKNVDFRNAVANASEENHHQMLKSLIEHKVLIAEDGIEALECAVKKNSVESVELLVQLGVPTTCIKFNEGMDILQLRTVKALLETQTEQGGILAKRIFEHVLKRGSIEVAQYLQGSHRVLETTDFHNSQSALHVAAALGKEFQTHAVQMCQWLEKWNMKGRDKDSRGWTSLHYAARAGNLELMKHFLTNDPALIESVNDYGQTILHFAAMAPFDEEIFQYLHGLDPKMIKKTDESKKTALHVAAHKGNFGWFEWLVENGADLDAFDNKGSNALHRVILAWHGEATKILDYLLLKKPEFFEKKRSDKNLETVSHLAVKVNNNKQKIEWLIEKKLDKHDVDNRGWNYLHLASDLGNIAVLKLIMEKRPQLIQSLTSDGENAMHLLVAVDYKVKKIKYQLIIDTLKHLHRLNEKLIKQKTLKNKTVVHYAVQRDNKEILEWLVDLMNLDVDAEDDDGWNTLHFAAASDREDYEVMDYLTSKNHELIQKSTKTLETTLHIAAMNRRIKTFTWLIKSGVDPELRNLDGKTALDVAHPDDVEKLRQILVSGQI